MTYFLTQARAQGHKVSEEETESSIVTRMVVEGWMGKPHYDYGPERRCPCLGIFPEFLGLDEIVVMWDWDNSGRKTPLAICGYHYAGLVCEACPMCVRCRRRMSHEHGHWICNPVKSVPEMP